MEATKKNTWGGSRGGGRPKNDRSINLSVRITQQAMDKLNESTNNKSEFIDNLLKNYTVMTNFFNELKARHNNSYFGESPICQAMYLHEVFDYNLFEEIRFSPLIGNKPAAFTIHKKDIEEGGKFYDFRNYSLMKMGREFSCDVSLS